MPTLLEWTANEAGSINVFDGMRFLHAKALVHLRDQHSHIFDDDPLPENPDTDDALPPRKTQHPKPPVFE